MRQALHPAGVVVRLYLPGCEREGQANTSGSAVNCGVRNDSEGNGQARKPFRLPFDVQEARSSEKALVVTHRAEHPAGQEAEICLDLSRLGQRPGRAFKSKIVLPTAASCRLI